MAKEKKSNLTTFLAITAGSLLVGYLLSLLAIWVYQSFLTGVSLGFGESILILGFMGCAIYSFTGLAIAIAYKKYID